MVKNSNNTYFSHIHSDQNRFQLIVIENQLDSWGAQTGLEPV